MNNKLLTALLFFALFYTLSNIVFFLTESSFAFSLALALSYSLLFFLFGEKTNTPVKIRKGALSLLFFLTSTIALSLLCGLVFKPDAAPTHSLATTVAAVFLMPICEELFFRGTLFSLLDKIIPTKLAAVLSSLVFALAHTGISGVLTAFVSGMILSYIYKKEGSLSLIILCHVANNAMASLITVPQIFQIPVVVILVPSAVLLYFSLRGERLK